MNKVHPSKVVLLVKNARLILDIHEYCENMNQEGILMVLDF